MAQTRYLRIKDLMERYDISRTTADKWISTGIVPGVVKVGGVIRIPAESLDNLVIPTKSAS